LREHPLQLNAGGKLAQDDAPGRVLGEPKLEPESDDAQPARS